MSKTELTKNSIIVFIATLISSASTFIFQIMMGRAMTMDHFGQLNALLSMQLIFSVPTGAIILLYTRHSAELWTLGRMGDLKTLYLGAWKMGVAASLICFVFILAAATLLQDRLNIDSFGMIVMAALLIVAYLFQAVPLAFVRGLQKFYLLSAGLSISGLLKIAAGAIFIYAGITVSNSIFAILISVIVSLVIMHVMIMPLMGNPEAEVRELNKSGMFSFWLRAMAGMFFPMFFINVDMILIRSLMEPEISGHYAAFMVIGKIVFLCGQVVSVALFPATVSSDTGNRASGNDLVFRAMLLALLGGALVLLLSWSYPSFILRILFKIDSPQAAAILPYYCAFLLAVTLILIEANHRLARRQYGFLWVAAAAGITQVVGVVHFSYSLRSIVMFQLLLFWTAFAVRFASLLVEPKPLMSKAET